MDINAVLKISDSYQAPAKIMEILYDRTRREALFKEMLPGFDYDVSFDWFHNYFQDEHADRKNKKQDFTPKGVADLTARLAGIGQGTTYDCAAGTGGMTIRKWDLDRRQHSPFDYRPSNYLYVCEELSERAIPFLLFNLILRGMNAIIVHCDALARKAYGAFFIQNDGDDHMRFSSLNVLLYSEDVAKFLMLDFIEEKYAAHIESKEWPQHLQSQAKSEGQVEWSFG